MAKDRDGRARGRFVKSGHTSYVPRPMPDPDASSQHPAYQPPNEPSVRHSDDPWSAQTTHLSRAAPAHESYRDPSSRNESYRESSYRDASGGPDPAEAPTTFLGPRVGSGATRELPAAKVHRGVGRGAVHGTNMVARTVTRKVIEASKADGADRSGLTALIWNQVLSYGADAMVTVALAGSVFFGASTHAQRGNVLLYLVITMAPFAVVAPVIGPLLDRLQHGRRWTMAGTAIGRGLLALVMAAYSNELLVLYPCALGSLVLSKAYGVVRAAAAPRLVPPGMTLATANSKLTIFGLASTLVLGGFVGAVIKTSGSYTAGLVVTAIGFFACAFFAFRLPKQVDSAAGAPRHPQEPPRPRSQERVPTMSRLHAWARKGFEPHLVIALQGESVLRLLSGFLTIYLAFYVESTQHALKGVLELGLVVGAAGLGNFAGTAIGTRLRMPRPELVVVVNTCAAAVVCLLVTIVFNVVLACVAMLLASTANALSKICLDSLIQRDVQEVLRSSAFGRSETFLQLAWVVGAAIGVAMPSKNGRDGAIAFIVAGVITAAVGVVIVLRNRAIAKPAPQHDRQPAPQPRGS